MWHKVMNVSDLAKDSGKPVEVAGKNIAFFNVAGKIYAMENRCLHRGGPLGDGHLEGTRVTCPWHAWEFDVKSGNCHTMKGAKQKKYATKLEHHEIFVEIPD
jgi:nitrite reductase/ring-hydroxylating ferredoxin subunit